MKTVLLSLSFGDRLTVRAHYPCSEPGYASIDAATFSSPRREWADEYVKSVTAVLNSGRDGAQARPSTIRKRLTKLDNRRKGVPCPESFFMREALRIRRELYAALKKEKARVDMGSVVVKAEDWKEVRS